MADIPPISNISTQLGQQKLDKSKRRKEKQTLGADRISKTQDMEQIELHVQQLIDMPDVRPEMVELGKKLAKSSSFPSAENLEKLAEALLSPIDEVIDED